MGSKLRAFARGTAIAAARDHYLRWIQGPGEFQRNSWGCAGGRYNHSQHIANLIDQNYGRPTLLKRNPPSYCDLNRSLDLWTIAGVAEIAAAAAYADDGLGLYAPEIQLLRSHAQLGASLMRQRHVSLWSDRADAYVAVVDPGAYTDHPDHAYAGYVLTAPGCLDCSPNCGAQCGAFPGWLEQGQDLRVPPPPPVLGVSWDISHARFFVPVYDSMFRHRAFLGADFPMREHIAELSRQFAFHVWNGSVTDPIFNNYLDGSNGWYRVNYRKRPGFGYAPGSRTLKIMSFGYGFWRELEPHLAKALDAAFAKYATNLDPGTPEGTNLLLSALPERLPYHGSEGWCSHELREQ